MLYSVGVSWTDCRILRGCVIQCGCVLDRLEDFEGLCYTVWVCLGQTAGFEGLCGCAFERLQDFEGLCYTVWVCLGQTAGF